MIYPPDFTYPWKKCWVAHNAAETIAKLSLKRRVVVQAGGCAGLWPVKLAEHFEQVYTFEPDPTNFKYLQANIADSPNISAFDCALSDTRKLVGLTRPKPKAGLWQIDGEGEVQAVTLDDFLGDVVVDAIVLDVEGHEVQAWRGAERLIAKHRPLLWFEFLHNGPEIEAFLAEHDYIFPAKGLDRDAFSVHSSRLVSPGVR